MLKVRLGFLKVLDREMPRGRAITKPIELRKDEPHPVCSLLAGGDFGEGYVEIAILGEEEAVQIMRGHRCACLRSTWGGR